jgi:lipopolysaccharide biosynthesis glycosyltransferase
MDKLVVFVTDTGFLVPSLVAAKQLVNQGIHKIADIVIYTVNIDNDLLTSLSRHAGNQHIRFESLPYELFAPPSDITFHKNHVPVTSLARLSLQEVIDPKYENIIYIDGDVQIVGDVSGLINYRVPDGKIFAGRGSAWLDSGSSSINMTPDNYMKNLGNLSPDEYFNAGVLAFRRETWQHAAPKALKFFFDNSEACLRHDQSALNAIFKGNIINFPPKYNFHSVYADLHVQNRYAPSIIHFTGPKKPWGPALAPWGRRFQKSYLDLVAEQPNLRQFLKMNDDRNPRSIARLIKSWLKEGRRLLSERGEISARRKAFFSYVNGVKFPA